jgi:hypothetical protein
MEDKESLCRDLADIREENHLRKLQHIAVKIIKPKLVFRSALKGNNSPDYG